MRGGVRRTHLDITVHHVVGVQILETLQGRLQVKTQVATKSRISTNCSYHNGVIHNVAELVLVEGGALG